MIELSTNTAMMIYLTITLSIILGLWISHHYKSKKRKIVTADQRLHRCEYCHFAYLEFDFKKITQCPQCNLYNTEKSLNSVSSKSDKQD